MMGLFYHFDYVASYSSSSIFYKMEAGYYSIDTNEFYDNYTNTKIISDMSDIFHIILNDIKNSNWHIKLARYIVNDAPYLKLILLKKTKEARLIINDKINIIINHTPRRGNHFVRYKIIDLKDYNGIRSII
jgi:hypothetical protein